MCKRLIKFFSLTMFLYNKWIYILRESNNTLLIYILVSLKIEKTKKEKKKEKVGASRQNSWTKKMTSILVK